MTYYLRQRLVLWTDITFEPSVAMPFPITLSEGPDGSMGCLLVYATLEAFQQAWPDEIPQEIRVTIPKEEKSVTH